MQSEIRHLEQKNKILEAENQQLTERAEDLLLISLISDNIAYKKSESEILQLVIENISIVKNFELTAIGELDNGVLKFIHQYKSVSTIPGINELNLNETCLSELKKICYCEGKLESFITVNSFTEKYFNDSTLLILPFDCKNDKSYHLVIITNQKPEAWGGSLGTIQQVVQFITTKIENLYLVDKLQQQNNNLEADIKNRTKLLLKEMTENESISELIRTLFKSRSIWEISNLVMETARKFTNSKEALIVYNNYKTGNLEAFAFTDGLKDICIYENDTFVIRASENRFSKALKTKKIVVFNDILNKSNDAKSGTNSLILYNFLSAPVIVQEKIIGQISLGNSTKDYSKESEKIIKDLAAIFGIAVHRLMAEIDLKEAKENAEKANVMKSEFLAQMSHEIRTPLNSILNFTSLIKESINKNEDEDLREGFAVIDSSSRRLIRTIDSILNISQLQTDSYDYNRKECDLKAILEEVINEFKHLAKDKSINLTTKFPAQAVFVNADEYSLGQTFANLIDNSIKYTEKGSVNISVRFLKNYLVVEINDTGIGMSDTFLSNLFEPFSQEESGYTRRFEGAGLGLALVKKYCELNGIQISVTSKKDVGTTFVLLFDKK